MVTTDLEKRIQLLEENVEEQEHRIEHREAAREVENVINKFEFYCEAGRWGDVVKMFAQKTPGVRAEILNWGVYEGTAGIKKLYLGVHKLDTYSPGGSGMRPGFFIVNTTTTPVIEVAGDRNTARMLWIVTGPVTTPPYFEAYWRWCKLAVDFVKEGREWKIWHYHVYGLFETSYYRDWTQPGRRPSAEAAPAERHKYGFPPVPDELKPDKPTTHPLWWYSPGVAVDPVPAPPEPYETFDENHAY